MVVRTNRKYSKRKRTKGRYSQQKRNKSRYSKRKYSKRKYSKRKYSKRKYSKRNSNKKIQFGGGLEKPFGPIPGDEDHRGEHYRGVIEKGKWGGREEARSGIPLAPGRVAGGWADMAAQERSVRFYPRDTDGNGVPVLYYGKSGKMTGDTAMDQNKVEIYGYRIPKSIDMFKVGVPNNVLRIFAKKTQTGAYAGWFGSGIRAKEAARADEPIEDGYWVCSKDNSPEFRDEWITIFNKYGIQELQDADEARQIQADLSAITELSGRKSYWDDRVADVEDPRLSSGEGVVVQGMGGSQQRGSVGMMRRDQPTLHDERVLLELLLTAKSRLSLDALIELIIVCEILWQNNIPNPAIAQIIQSCYDEIFSSPGQTFDRQLPQLMREFVVSDELAILLYNYTNLTIAGYQNILQKSAQRQLRESMGAQQMIAQDPVAQTPLGGQRGPPPDFDELKARFERLKQHEPGR